MYYCACHIVGKWINAARMGIKITVWLNGSGWHKLGALCWGNYISGKCIRENCAASQMWICRKIYIVVECGCYCRCINPNSYAKHPSNGTLFIRLADNIHILQVILKDDRTDNGTSGAVIKPPNTNPNPITNTNPSPNDETLGHTMGQLPVGLIRAPAVPSSGPSSCHPIIF